MPHTFPHTPYASIPRTSTGSNTMADVVEDVAAAPAEGEGVVRIGKRCFIGELNLAV